MNFTVEEQKGYIFLCRHVFDKGVHIAKEALRIAIDTVPYLFEHSVFTIVREGPELAPLQLLVQKLNLQERVIFSCSKKGKALKEELNRHCYLLVPSLWQEPFGIVVLEGQACGCLPIAARSGGLSDAVGAAGELFECGNSGSLAERMIYLKENPVYEENLRAAAPAHLQRHFSKNVAQQYLQVLKSVTDKQCKTNLLHHHENRI